MNSSEAKISYTEKKVSVHSAGLFPALMRGNSPIKNYKVSESLKNCLAM